MAFTQAAHPIIWELTQHPMVMAVLALGIGVVVAFLLYGIPTPGPLGFTDANFSA